jgi:hypothetical protein
MYVSSFHDTNYKSMRIRLVPWWSMSGAYLAIGVYTRLEDLLNHLDLEVY